MTVDIAAVAAQADALWRNPNHPASVAYDVAKLWEQAARDLAAERDQFRDSALMYAAEAAELRAALPRDGEENRQYGRLMPSGRVIPSALPDPTHYRLTGPWVEVQP